jgi:hypothetical protein
MSRLSSRLPWAQRWLHFDSMPIHINLLAESQALEEMRRRDPVKRTIWVGGILGALVLAWSGYLQTKVMVVRSEVSRLEAQGRAHEAAYKQIRENEKKLAEANNKLISLQRLATNRFLNGTVLDALQHTTVDDVQLMHFKTANDYDPIAEIKAKTNSATGRIIPAKPPMVTEKIVVTLDGKDNSGGEQVIKFKEAIGDCAYFQSVLGKTNEVRLTNIQPPQTGTDGKTFRLFTLECKYPERTR